MCTHGSLLLTDLNYKNVKKCENFKKTREIKI